ncbi:MAG: DMT family transporter [Nitrospinota bacterium]
MAPLFLAEILAVIAAIAMAAGDVFGRFAIRHAPPFMGGFMSAVVGLVVFGAIWLAIPSQVPVNLPGVYWFLLAGIVHPSFGFIVVLKSFQRIGVTRTAAIVGTSPLFSVLVAVAFLGERPGWIAAGGTGLIVLGVVFISQGRGAKGPMRGKDMGYAILGAFLFGIVPVFRKLGMNYIPSAIFGMALSSLAGIVSLTATVRLFPAGERFSKQRKGVALYTASGAIFALAVYLYFVALEKGTVSVVVPILFTYPLFVLAIAYFVLRQFERITPRVACGAVLTVLGVFVISGFG